MRLMGVTPPSYRFLEDILMKKRLISGSAYIATLVGFFCLKIFVHDFFFDALIYAFGLVGTFEVSRAFREKTTDAERCVTYAYALTAIPTVALCENFLGAGLIAMGVLFFAYAVAMLCLLVVDYEQTSLESLGVSLLSGVYPTLLLCLMTLANHAVAVGALSGFAFDSRILILFIFVVSPCADSIAYVFGCTLRKKFPKKMAPSISPNKTLIGGLGGLVGGMLGALVLYFAYNGICGSFENMGLWLPVYLGIGLLAALATAFGDLVESAIKRKIGIKDMGKILPGHGGILDRIDGSLFASVVVYAAFVLVGCLV